MEVAEPSWADVAVDGLRTETTEPLRAWRVALDAAGSGFDLRFAAVSPPVELAALGGMEGYEQLCRVEGTVHVGERPEDSSVEVSIDASSVNTHNPPRDEHMRSADFLDVQNFPKIEFRSTKTEVTGDTALRVHGDLTVRGITKPVALDVQYLGLFPDPWGNTRAGFAATAEIDREEWGMTWNQALETGGVLVGRTLRVELDVQAILQKQE